MQRSTTARSQARLVVMEYLCLAIRTTGTAASDQLQVPRPGHHQPYIKECWER